jgi:hypothetical protein
MGTRLRGFIVLMILVLINISLTSGLKISASTGDASGSSGYTDIVEAKTNEQISGFSVLAGPSLHHSFSGTAILQIMGAQSQTPMETTPM